MKKIICLYVLMILLIFDIFSQKKVVFLDSINNKPIEFFSIFSTDEKYLAMGDIDGKIELSKDLLIKYDTIIFYHISYPQLKFATKNIESKVLIAAKNYNIDCINVKYKKIKYKKIKAGCLSKNWGWATMSPPAQSGIYIDNNYANKDVMITGMNVYIENSFFDPTQLFRIHLYHGNYNKRVGNDILMGKNIYAHAVKGGSWVHIDLDSLNISLPEDGVIAAVECLGSKKSDAEFQKYYDQEYKNKDTIFFKYIGKEQWLNRVRYGFKIPLGRKLKNCKVRGDWSKNGLGEWTKSKSVNLAAIYLDLKIRK